MKDLVPKGTGNSRFLRSSIPENITHAELVALLRAGTFPVDFAGLNADGVAVVGSAYSKANVLPDDVCTALGIPASAEPKDAFYGILKKISDSAGQVTSNILSRFISGTYVGNGNANREIVLGAEPKFVAVSTKYGNQYEDVMYGDYATCKNRTPGIIVAPNVGVSLTATGFKVYMSGSASRGGELLNEEGTTYTYFAVI